MGSKLEASFINEEIASLSPDWCEWITPGDAQSVETESHYGQSRAKTENDQNNQRS